MVRNIAYYLILGSPVIMYAGMVTLFSFIFTTMVGILNLKGIRIISFKWHPRLAAVSILLGMLHAILGLSAYFNF